MTWCLTSGGDGIRLRSYLNHYIWAQENGIEYRLEIGLQPGRTSPYDAKYPILRRGLARFDWVMWVDDDVYFTRWSAEGVQRLIAQAEAAGGFAVLAEGPREPNGSWSRINSGVMLLRRDPRTTRLLERASATDIGALRERWDAEADGSFSGGDQDALWHAIKSDPGLREGTIIVGHAELNSRPHLMRTPDDGLTAHFCGDHKQSRIHEFARRHDLGLELVPEPLLDKYGVRDRERSSLRRYLPLRYRREVFRLRRFGRRVRAKIAWLRTRRRWR